MVKITRGDSSRCAIDGVPCTSPLVFVDEQEENIKKIPDPINRTGDPRGCRVRGSHLYLSEGLSRRPTVRTLCCIAILVILQHYDGEVLLGSAGS